MNSPTIGLELELDTALACPCSRDGAREPFASPEAEITAPTPPRACHCPWVRDPPQPGARRVWYPLHFDPPVTTLLEDIKSYISFGDEDARALREFLPVATPSFQAISDHFYDLILAHPNAHAAITGGSEQVERLKRTLMAWMESGLRGPHDEAFWTRRARIGQVHVAIGLPQRYMFTAMNVMRLDFRAVVEREIPDLAPARVLNAALDKLFDLELAIMLHAYQEDSEARLRQRERARLSEKLMAVGTLSSGLAHEIRNPLNGAALQLQLLERRASKLERGDSLKGIVETVQSEVARLSSLVDDFLHFARPTSLRLQEVDLSALAQHVVELERLAATEASVTLDCNIEQAPLRVRGDGGRLEQVLLNLVRNAREAVEAGGHVQVSAHPSGDGVALLVSDDGPGIPPELHSRIFEPFFSTKENGTGLGMAICHSLVSLHGGEIQLKSRPGATEFRVWLPLVPPTPGQDANTG